MTMSSTEIHDAGSLTGITVMPSFSILFSSSWTFCMIGTDHPPMFSFENNHFLSLPEECHKLNFQSEAYLCRWRPLVSRATNRADLTIHRQTVFDAPCIQSQYWQWVPFFWSDRFSLLHHREARRCRDSDLLAVSLSMFTSSGVVIVFSCFITTSLVLQLLCSSPAVMSATTSDE